MKDHVSKWIGKDDATKKEYIRKVYGRDDIDVTKKFWRDDL